MLVQAPPTSSMRINGDVIDYLQARRNGDWASIKEYGILFAFEDVYESEN
jgi:hypothetical protein